MDTHFKHLLLRRYLLSFGSLFDNITLTREDTAGDEVYRQIVPIEYGPKERWLTRLTQDPDLKRGVGQVVPRLSYEMSAIAYDTTRKLNTLGKLTYAGASSSDNQGRLYVGTPYTLNIGLSVLTKLQQDGMQIVEQILPYFTPDYTIAVEPLANYPTLVDVVPIVLQSISQTDNYEGSFETRRVIVWDLEFAMQVYFYGPVKDKARIKKVIVDLYNSSSDDLSAPAADAVPQVKITVVPSASVSASASPSTAESSVINAREAAVTTITEDFGKFEPSTSPSASRSPSASVSPSASISPSASASSSTSPSASASPSS